MIVTANLYKVNKIKIKKSSLIGHEKNTEIFTITFEDSAGGWTELTAFMEDEFELKGFKIDE
ncbi:MAG: hypothetical protein WC465_04965 [Patescibacteria group bacterium]